eukprot:scaffold673535_cov61-Prasinocladus_malaysianus.AAC.2
MNDMSVRSCISLRKEDNFKSVSNHVTDETSIRFGKESECCKNHQTGAAITGVAVRQVLWTAWLSSIDIHDRIWTSSSSKSHFRLV